MAATELITKRLVIGLQPVREAIRAHGARVARVFLVDDGSPALAGVERFAQDRGIATSRVGRRELDALSSGGFHQGVACDAPELALLTLEDVIVAPSMLAVALDAIQDPQNFGAVVRSAVALANAAVVWPEHSAAPLSPATFRASAGAIEHARLCRVRSLRSALGDCSAAGVEVVALDSSGDIDIRDVDLTGPTIIVVGSEGTGLRKSTRACASVVARLPMSGPLASLNASVATAVALYEAVRQRTIDDERT